MTRFAGLVLTAVLFVVGAAAYAQDESAPVQADRQRCPEPVFARQARRYSDYRDGYLIAEARYLYCIGELDQLPAWARAVPAAPKRY